MRARPVGVTRRSFMAATAATVGALSVARPLKAVQTQETPVTPGRIRQSVCQWCFKMMSVEELAANAARIGLVGIDLVGPEHFETLKKHNLIGTMTPSHGLTKGLNNPANHAECLEKIRRSIDATADAGFPNVICFSGNRDGMPDDEGLRHCADAIKQVVGYAEQKRVTLCMELLNSKTNHPGYMADRTAWGVALCEAVGSERFKLLYDIYHMQIMEGDVIATIRAAKGHIAHYHTAGVPGRNEIDDTQELNYPAIMRAIADTGFTGYVAHEFLPKRDPVTSLADATKRCSV